ncbi:hypothetical protein [Faecalibaculum rodentium]|uniref:hypothetical protein n=1 Tax=Faecalibaculum rodentium TaxID=1702221 RepID=UPI00259B104D|nr:hypothetical protein [Faecalibaculum rodentium]
MSSKSSGSKSTYKTMDDIASFIDGMKFRRKTFGGVDELDVLRQMEALQQVYRSVYENQAAYYQALIDERDAMIARLKRG